MALELLRTNKVDLILMDIMMPVMDGYETIRAIKGDKELKGIPVIAVTAKSLKSDKEKCIEAGADDYISKPLPSIIRSICKITRWARASTAINLTSSGIT